MTSFDVVAFVRRILNVKKAGHCGSLDPDAAGVLPVCVGAATGIAGLLTDADKAYRVEAVAGLLTDTLDTSGEVLDRGAETMPERGCFEAALRAFVGKGEQTPPMFSAVKIGGQKLYKLARKGLVIERAPRPVTIYSLNIVYYGPDKLILDVACSKGTYIRSLCGDIGAALGMYLCVSFLLRTQSSGLSINDAHTLETVKARAGAGDVDSILIPADAMLGSFPKLDIPDNHYIPYMNGATVPLAAAPATGATVSLAAAPATGATATLASAVPSVVESGDAPRMDLVRVYHSGRFLGLGKIIYDSSGRASLRVKKFIIDSQ